METIVETTTLEAVPAATRTIENHMREHEQTQEVLALLKPPFDKRFRNAMAVVCEVYGRWADDIDTGREALPEEDWRAALLGEHHAFITAVLNAHDMLDG